MNEITLKIKYIFLKILNIMNVKNIILASYSQ